MIYEIGYTPKSVRMYKKLTIELQSEVKIALGGLADSQSHSNLGVHILSGKLSGIYSARVNYSHRILFQIQKNQLIVLAIGSHDIYR
jgi:mRNA-degrading endonuclease YafQ of YafQ-DinJ toxin-antitoxin module